MARALNAHDRDGSLRQINRAKQVGVDLRAEILDACVFDRTEAPVAGYVRQHVQSAEPFDRAVHGGFRRDMVGHIERPEDYLGWVSISQILKAAGVPRRGDEIVARGKHRFGEGATEASRTSCNEPG